MAQGRKLNTKQLTDIANMYLQGFTYEAMGQEIGCSKQTIYNNIRNNPELKSIIDDMRDKYADQICDLAVDCLKEVLLNSSDVPKTILVQYLGIAMKYSGLATTSQLNVKEDKNISIKDINLDDLLSIKA